MDIVHSGSPVLIKFKPPRHGDHQEERMKTPIKNKKLGETLIFLDS
jgi:hypothetical protein